MLATLNLIIFKAEFESVFHCLNENLSALERGQILFVFKHEHSEFVEEFIVNSIENISTALTAVRSS